jgi:membrane protease YdiL (CAAX protease family)
MEGRIAPGLFVAGRLATVIGAVVAVVGFTAGATVAGAILFVVGLAVLLLGLVLLGGSQVVERRSTALAYAGPSPIVVFAAAIVGLYLAVVVVATPLGMAGVRLEGPALSLFGVILQAAVVLGILQLFVVGPGAMRWRDMGLRASMPAALRDLSWGAVLASPVVLVTALAVAVVVNVVGSAPESPLPPTGTPTGFAMNLLSGAVIAPFYEELLFRGFATTAWARMVSPAVAVVRTSLLFAVAHVLTQGGETFSAALGPAIVAGVARIPVALALGTVFVRRGSLWAAIGLHAAFNAILLVLAEYAFENLPLG